MKTKFEFTEEMMVQLLREAPTETLVASVNRVTEYLKQEPTKFFHNLLSLTDRVLREREGGAV